MKTYTQVPLPVVTKTNAKLSEFMGENNQLVLHHIQDEKQHLIYLSGKAQSGKSYLLHASCEQINNSIYLPLKEILNLNPEITNNLEQYDLIAIDDVDAINNSKPWQHAIFSLYNRCVTHKKKLMIASSYLPNQFTEILPDLQSRFSAMLLLTLQDLSDEEKIHYLIKQADKRSIYIAEEIARYIVTHYPRDLQQLNLIIDKLDQASLVAKRKITLPFVKEVLGEG